MGADFGRGLYDPVVALQNAPQLMGMELRPSGPNKLEGGYYINGDLHQWRRDKLKVYIWKGQVFVSEEGGQTLSLVNWLIQYGGCADFKDALRTIKGQPQHIEWNREFRQKSMGANKHVLEEVLDAAKRWDYSLSPLYRHMCTLFREQTVRAVWEEYNVTANSKGATVFWYLNANGQICHDKVVWFGEDGHRKKDLPMGRVYKMADGFTEKPLFGAHLEGPVMGVLESEKSCLYAACYYGGVWYASGGKNNLRDVAGLPLYPDRDAFEEWSAKGDCVPWFEGWAECGEHSDLADFIEWKIVSGQ
jgi:hypothetical protein